MDLKANSLEGKLKGEADGLSQVSSRHEWMLHTIDRFASKNVTQLRKHKSRYADPFCHGIGALFQSDWSAENNYVNAPLGLLNSVIQIIETQQATATVIAPKWRGKWWHQKLRALSIAPPIKLPNAKEFCIDKGISTPEPKKNIRWVWCTCRICGQTAYDKKAGKKYA